MPLFCCGQASTDLNINGLMALSPKAGWLKETKTGSSESIVPTESCCSRVRRSHCPISTWRRQRKAAARAASVFFYSDDVMNSGWLEDRSIQNRQSWNHA